ncbi:BRCA1 BRCA2-containing complex, subunit 3 [Rhizophlyctis rosea]|nr:BRCA1 BRCA2-containing complex, subunit 3 [Rhizophlyctis rosea]
MALAAVHLSPEVHLLCMTYGLCTEKEETLALLLGSFENQIAKVDKCIFMTRKDKRKDRVEISSEQLSAAMAEAEKLETQVVGWAHSHPHITVFPSHVDLQTQHSLQMLDARFVGLIFSCFNNDHETQRMQVISFQALETPGSSLSRAEIPLHIIPTNTPLSAHTLHQLTNKLPAIYYEEEKEARANALLNHPAENGGEHKVAHMYHDSIFMETIALLTDRLLGPTMQFCVDRNERNNKL